MERREKDRQEQPEASAVPERPPGTVLEGRRLRRFEERRSAGRGPRDVDAAERVNRLKAAGWGLVGAMIGAAGGAFGLGGVQGALIGGLLVGGFVCFGSLLVARGAGDAVSSIYMPSGRTTPRDREYSLAESLVARGRYEDAVSAFEVALAEHPEDPVPYLRIARIHRDHLDRPEEAVRWFKRARRDATIDDGRAHLVVRELVELYRKMGTPTKAAPELARMADRQAGTPQGEWARAELAEVKKLIADQRS